MHKVSAGKMTPPGSLACAACAGYCPSVEARWLASEVIPDPSANILPQVARMQMCQRCVDVLWPGVGFRRLRDSRGAEPVAAGYHVIAKPTWVEQSWVPEWG